MTPFVRVLDKSHQPLEIYERFSRRGGASVLLESARQAQKTGRYSIIASRPFLCVESNNGQTSLFDAGDPAGRPHTNYKTNPFDLIRCILKTFSSESIGGLPFTGGAIGYFGYEAKNWLDGGAHSRAPLPRRSNNPGFPDIYLAFYDEGVVIDHESGKTYLFVNERAGGKAARARADRRLDQLEVVVGAQRAVPTRIRNFDVGATRRVAHADDIRSMAKSDFTRMVRRAKQHIQVGDIYQANLSQRFEFDVNETPLEIYKKIRRVNPGPFFGLFDAGDFQIISGSPERLLKCEGRSLETRPIAGTRSRGRTRGEDSALSLELLLNEKERAEHIMLVDLERNDLGRVSEYGSVAVDEFMALEDYSHVKHIVSNITGSLREGLDPIDAFMAFFPGGTITGAPKIRSMEIIDALEPVARGPYTGSLGYFSFSGNMDFNILIRSLVIKNGQAVLQAGAGIVADSDPEKEYAETLYKAEAVLSALFGERQARKFVAGRQNIGSCLPKA